MECKLRLLVAICSYGARNLERLRTTIQNYKRLPLNVHVVVLSEAPKDLCEDVEMAVGLPTKNPWSLPFAHRPIFAREANNYDLFIYTEDDILFTERNLGAFLRATPELARDEIAGYLHYEKDLSGRAWMVGVHGSFHWKAESVRQRGSYRVAEFSNEHTGFYVLTQDQLKRAIASGGFLRAPYENLYDMLCCAATDPYTCCGFRKVICISALEDFLIHHMPNKYVGQLDVSLVQFREQVQTLFEIGNGMHPARNLFDIQAKFWRFWWQKSYYEKPGSELLEMVPDKANDFLSIGCGWGATEAKLVDRGAKVTALPLDSVIGATAALRGIAMLYGTWDECLEKLNGRRFDCVLATNLVHLQPNPGQFVEQCSRFVKESGTLVLVGPNFNRVACLIKRVVGNGAFRKLESYEASGMSVCGPGTLAKSIRRAGLRVNAVRWLDHEIHRGWLHGKRIPLGRLTARDWILRAQR